MRLLIEAVSPMLSVQFGQASDFGKVRTNNEEAMGSFIPASRHQAHTHGYLFAVADGVKWAPDIQWLADARNARTQAPDA